MSAFTALNIIPDDDSDSDVDNTKEIQIEEALKLYQSALRLHSQCPTTINEAYQAYIDLFQSEIFRYPESLPVSERTDEPDFTPAYPDEIEDDTLAVGPRRSMLGTAMGVDGSPSTLPQILHLAYKNRGQFGLDFLKFHMDRWKAEAAAQGVDRPIPKLEVIQAVATSLQFFSEALVRDETDSELWRRTARIGAALGSERIARFALEAVVAQEDVTVDGGLSTLRLEEAIAGEELKELLHHLKDSSSLTQPALSQLEHKHLAPALKSGIDLYPYLPHVSKDGDEEDSEKSHFSSAPVRQNIHVPVQSWAATGKALLQVIAAQLLGQIDVGPGAGVRLESDDGSWAVSADEEGGPADLDELAGIPEDVPPTTADANQTNDEGETMKDSGPSSEGDAKSGKTSAPDNDTHGDEAKSTARSPRKRNLSAAASPDAPDGGRVRSKRIKARESIADAGANEELSAQELARQIEADLAIYLDADAHLSDVFGQMLEPLALETIGTLVGLKQQALEGAGILHTAVADTFALLQDVLDEKTTTAVYNSLLGPGTLSRTSDANSSRNMGLTTFLEHAKRGSSRPDTVQVLDDSTGLVQFARGVNSQWLHVKQAALEWLKSLLASNQGLFTDRSASAYAQQVWPLSLKEAVVQTLVTLDDVIYDLFREIYHETRSTLADGAEGRSAHIPPDPEMLDMAQTIFELHLDIYERITNPSSEVRLNTRLAQKDRLSRWSSQVGGLINVRSGRVDGTAITDPLDIRFLWASTIHAGMSDGVPREHVVLLMTDIKDVLQKAGDPVIKLPNNVIMPEISVSAAEKEISRLTTMDFFLSIFQNHDAAEPLHIIETLEPVLDPQAVERADDPEASPRLEAKQQDPTNLSRTHDMTKFLETASVSLRLLLWKRLQDAYTSIQYTPKIVSCYLRSIEVIIGALEDPSYQKLPPADRQASLAVWLATLDDLVIRTLTLALNESTAFDCIDEEHIATSLSAVGKMCRLLHTFLVVEDSFRAEQSRPSPKASQTGAASFTHLVTNFHDKQVRAWTLFYAVAKEAMTQHKEIFSDSKTDLLVSLRALHHSFGIRNICHGSNQIFVKLFRLELLKAKVPLDFEGDMIQLLYDLHGFRLGSTKYPVEDHDATPSAIEKGTAIRIMDFVMRLVRRVNPKDLAKTEYKSVLDNMQQAISAPKYSQTMLHNQRLLRAFLQTSINPQHLYRCLKGVCELSTVPDAVESAKVANKGWYLMLGQLSLERFRSQKRVSQGPTDELDLAMYYFKLDLHFGMDRWETWYGQALALDAQVEEESLWTADKLNNDRPGLNLLQRQAVHCYTMAVSCAVRLIEPTPEELRKVSDLYADFGRRMYASSRPPYSMTAFWLDDFERHFSGSGEMYKKIPHTELTEYKAWAYARALFQKALVEKSQLWQNHYMMGKCLWKMFNHEDNVRNGQSVVEVGDVLYAFTRAIETIPDRRSDRQDPILEPHYKLVSVVHKLVRRKHLEPERGSDFLKATPYTRKVPPARDWEEWEPYVLQVLKALRNADKANWHHRMTARAAHVIYDEASNDLFAAAAARHELNQQIFTKTMAIQVWKPEFERAGRHFVYTSRYASFFTRLLLQLNDRASMELLAKRVRKRTSDFYDHTRIWTGMCAAYITVLRRSGHIAVGHEEAFLRGINREEYMVDSARLEAWCAEQPSTANPILGILRDAMELKKLNNGLVQGSDLDDLVADTYARLYETAVPSLPPAPTPSKETDVTATDNEAQKMSIGSMLMTSSTGHTSDSPSGNAGRPATSAAPRARVKGVSRREALRHAKGIASKPAPSSTPSASTNGGAKSSRSSAPQQQRRQQRDDDADVDGPKDEPDTGGSPLLVGSSPLPSLHDSADDESGVDEEDDPKPLFPNLARTGSIAKAGTDEDDEDDDEQSEDGGEGNDGDDENEEAGEDEGADEDEAREGDEAELGEEGNTEEIGETADEQEEGAEGEVE